MSAWIVPKEHIDIVVTVLLEDKSVFTDEDKDSVGQCLWEECWKSVAARYSHYPDGERPGPVGFTYDEIADYRYREPQFKLTDGEKLSALGCYAYQSCEHREWNESLAYDLVTKAQERIGKVEYEGPWGWDEDDISDREKGLPPLTD